VFVDSRKWRSDDNHYDSVRGIEELLARPAADPATEMDALIDSVLEKNAELYRRLA
jgi:hypothetical protein